MYYANQLIYCELSRFSDGRVITHYKKQFLCNSFLSQTACSPGLGVTPNHKLPEFGNAHPPSGVKLGTMKVLLFNVATSDHQIPGIATCSSPMVFGLLDSLHHLRSQRSQWVLTFAL